MARHTSDKYLEALADGSSRTVNEIAELVGSDRTAADVALRRLKNKGKILVDNSRVGLWYYVSGMSQSRVLNEEDLRLESAMAGDSCTKLSELVRISNEIVVLNRRRLQLLEEIKCDWSER